MYLIFYSFYTAFLHTNLSYKILRFIFLIFSNSFTNDSYFGHSHRCPLIGIICKGQAMIFFTGNTSTSDILAIRYHLMTLASVPDNPTLSQPPNQLCHCEKVWGFGLHRGWEPICVQKYMPSISSQDLSH